MRLDRYMELCLSHPEHGYYMQRQPFGKAGDFITSPEISQMFGELVGLWLVHMWHELGAPSPFALVELGPGRGTLMADVLRVAKLQPAFLEAMQINLVETSPQLRKAQKAALRDYEISHLGSVNEIPDMPLILIANEFFDALPIRQFVKNDFGWQERLLNADLMLTLSKTREMPELEADFQELETGKIVETCTQSRDISNVITKSIATRGGVALIIDYGDFSGVGDTFQAVKNHKKVDPLDAPGNADLTAHVRFSDLVQNEVEHAFTTQGEFLSRLGIDTRRAALETNSGRSLKDTQTRLIGADEMGRIFKVLAMSSSPLNQSSGFY